MKTGLPTRIVFQIFRNMSGEENVAGIAAIHHPLRDVDPRACDVRLFVQISDFIDRTAVNAHPDAKLGIALERLSDLHRT